MLYIYDLKNNDTMYVHFESIFIYSLHLIVNKTEILNLPYICRNIKLLPLQFFRLLIYTIYDYNKIYFSENIYFHEDMNEKHSFIRDTCILPGGAGKRGWLTDNRSTHNK